MIVLQSLVSRLSSVSVILWLRRRGVRGNAQPGDHDHHRSLTRLQARRADDAGIGERDEVRCLGSTDNTERKSDRVCYGRSPAKQSCRMANSQEPKQKRWRNRHDDCEAVRISVIVRSLGDRWDLGILSSDKSNLLIVLQFLSGPEDRPSCYILGIESMVGT